MGTKFYERAKLIAVVVLINGAYVAKLLACEINAVGCVLCLFGLKIISNVCWKRSDLVFVPQNDCY